MGLFKDHNVEKTLRDILEVEKQILKLLQKFLQPPPAATLHFQWGTPYPARVLQPTRRTLFKESDMSVSLLPGQSVSFTVSPLDASGNPSSATLSNLSFTSSDPTVFTVAPDPSNPNGGIVTALTPPVTPDSAALSAFATATESDGVTTESISGTDTVTVTTTTPPPPPPNVAASLQITWGVPAARGGASARPSGPVIKQR